MTELDQERPADLAAREALLDACFGAGRLEKASYSLRRGVDPIGKLSLVLREAGKLVGTVRFWPVVVVDMLAGEGHEALLLGPIAIDPACRGRKLSRLLMEAALARADAMGHRRILLVGERALYEPYGFRSVAPCHITLPGGRDADRLMVRQNGCLKTLPSVGQLVAPGLQSEATRPIMASASPHGEPVYLSA